MASAPAPLPPVVDGKRLAPVRLASPAAGRGLVVATSTREAGTRFYAYGKAVVKQSKPAEEGQPPPQEVFAGCTTNVTHVAVSPDGASVAATQGGGTPDVVVFDADTGAVRARLSEHDGELVRAVAYSDDGRVLATAGDDKIIFWDAHTFNVIASFAAAPNPVACVAFGPGDAARGVYELAAGGKDTLLVWELDATAGRVTMRKAMAGTYQRTYTAICFDGDAVCAGTASGDVLTFGLDGLNLRTVQQAVGHGVTGVLPTASGQLLVAGGDGTLAVLPREGEYASTDLPRTHLHGGISSIDADADGATIVVATNEGCMYDVGSSDLAVSQWGDAHVAGVRAVCWPKEAGSAYLAASDDGTVRVWQAEGAGLPSRVARVFLHGAPEPALCVAVLPNGDVVSGWADGTLRCHALLDPSAGSSDVLADELWAIAGAGGRNGASVTAVAVGEDGAVVACGGSNGDLNVFDVATRRLIHMHPEHQKEVTRLAFFTEGPVLLSASRDKTFSIIDVYTKQRISQHMSRTTNIADAVICPDQVTVLTCGQDGAICYWRLEETAPAMIVEKAHEHGVTCMALDSTGEHLVTGGIDGFVRLWLVETGELLSEGALHTTPVRSVAFHWKGDQLVSGAEDGSLVLWSVAQEA